MMCPDIRMRKLRLRQAWSFVEGLSARKWGATLPVPCSRCSKG